MDELVHAEAELAALTVTDSSLSEDEGSEDFDNFSDIITSITIPAIPGQTHGMGVMTLPQGQNSRQLKSTGNPKNKTQRGQLEQVTYLASLISFSSPPVITCDPTISHVVSMWLL